MVVSLLFGRRKTVDLATSDLRYDPLKQMNMVTVDGEPGFAIDQPGRLPTNSKTRQAPGDDDPDVATEGLY
jgi:hypothetical protein